MPTSSSVNFDRSYQQHAKNSSVREDTDKNLLKIQPALPVKNKRGIYVRSHSTLGSTGLRGGKASNDDVLLKLYATDGFIHVSRSQKEKESLPERLCLDRRGITTFPVIDGEPRLRLLSLQHNLINNLNGLLNQTFPNLVFLDMYDNQLERIEALEKLENLRVLLLGKNRIKKIEGLDLLKKLEVLDLHGNQIQQVGGLNELSELKVLNLAGNQIKGIGVGDFLGLEALQELNLRRNRLRKLLGFGDTPNLIKLFLSNNDIVSIEDMCSIARSANIKELSIDNNPVFLTSDCISFLVSYLPITKLNNMQITEQAKRAAMAWRRNKESSNPSFMELNSDISSTIRREEVISNARTNWELLRSQTKCLGRSASIDQTKQLQPETDIILTSLSKTKMRTKSFSNISKNVLPDKRNFGRTSSQDTENSQNTSSSSCTELKLPPILAPLIGRSIEDRESIKTCGSFTSIGPNVNSSVSSLGSDLGVSSSATSPTGSPEPRSPELDLKKEKVEVKEEEVNSNISSNTGSSSTKSSTSIRGRTKSAHNNRNVPTRCCRASTALIKSKKSPSKDREQGGDFLIEICGRYLNVYGQGALRFIDKQWNPVKANDVTTVKFNYVNFNSITGVLGKLKNRFHNLDSLVFKETNISCLGQLNALAEVQGFSTLEIEEEGNPICGKSWRSYAVYRLGHWGLKMINGVLVTEEEIKKAQEEFEGLEDLVMLSLPESLLEPLLDRLRIDFRSKGDEGIGAKGWLKSADPALKMVVCKEALQWKKGPVAQEDLVLRQKAKMQVGVLLEEMKNAAFKVSKLESEFPPILHEIVQNAFLDYMQLDIYMKQKIQDLYK